MPKIDPFSPWMQPLNAKVLGGLRGMMTQQADGLGTTILRPRPMVQESKDTYSYIQGQY